MTPLGMDGIAPDGTRILLCGLSYRDLISCAGMNQKEAAAKLGVNYNWFNQTVKRFGMSHWYPTSHPPRPRCISKEDIIAVAKEGYTKKDAAFILGVHHEYLKKLVTMWGLRGYFPNCGEASAIAKRGYAT